MWRRIGTREAGIELADTVVFETVFTLQRFYKLSRTNIRDGVLPLLTLRGARLPNKGRYRRAFELYVTMPALAFADCYHVAFMESRSLTDLISFDRDLSRVPTITRFEPDDAGYLR